MASVGSDTNVLLATKGEQQCFEHVGRDSIRLEVINVSFLCGKQAYYSE